jgi:hypothetical protein
MLQTITSSKSYTSHLERSKSLKSHSACCSPDRYLETDAITTKLAVIVMDDPHFLHPLQKPYSLGKVKALLAKGVIRADGSDPFENEMLFDAACCELLRSPAHLLVLHLIVPYQRLISSVRGPNNYFLSGPTIRRGLQYFRDNSAKEHSSAKSNHCRPLASENNNRPFRRQRKIFSENFGTANIYSFFDEIKRWYGIFRTLENETIDPPIRRL